MPTTLALSDLTWQRLTDTPGAVTTYNPETLLKTPPVEQWRVFYPDAGYPHSDRAGGGFQELRWGFYLVCVGLTRQLVLNAVDRSRGQLLGWSPLGDGGPLLEEQDIAAPLIKDDSVSPIRLSNTLRFTLNTTRS